MSTPLIVIILVAVAFAAIWMIWSKRQVAHHLDDLHITSKAREDQKTD